MMRLSDNRVLEPSLSLGSSMIVTLARAWCPRLAPLDSQRGKRYK